LNYFKGYDRTLLGTYVHHRTFRHGVKVTCVVAHFPQLVFLQTFNSPPPSRMSRAECLELASEVEAWSSGVYEIEKQRAEFDFERARPMDNGRGCTVLVLPKETK